MRLIVQNRLSALQSMFQSLRLLQSSGSKHFYGKATSESRKLMPHFPSEHFRVLPGPASCCMNNSKAHTSDGRFCRAVGRQGRPPKLPAEHRGTLQKQQVMACTGKSSDQSLVGILARLFTQMVIMLHVFLRSTCHLCVEDVWCYLYTSIVKFSNQI